MESEIEINKIKINNERLQFKMNEGQSFSFLSFQSQINPNLTFHSYQPFNSKQSLQGSSLHYYKGNQTTMSNKLEIVLLLQAAEIQRLTLNLNQYRTKFKQLKNTQKDYGSFQNQADQLLNVKDEIELKNAKMKQIVQNQNGSLNDINKYLQSLESKYKRSLKFIEETAIARQQIQTAYIETKEQLTLTKSSFSAFKYSSIREYQMLREQLEDARKADLSFEGKHINTEKERLKEIINRSQSTFIAERERFEIILNQQRDRLIISNNEIKRLSTENEQYKKIAQKCQKRFREASNQKENSLTLASLQIQRLNSVIRQKSNLGKQSQRLFNDLQQIKTKSQEQVNLLRREIERAKQKNSLYQEQINKQNQETSKLSAYSSALVTKVNQMVIQIEEKNMQIKAKENRLNLQLRNHGQSITKSQEVFHKQIEEYRMANSTLSHELAKARQQLVTNEQIIKKKEFQIAYRLQDIEMEMQRLKLELNTIVQKERKARQELKNVMTKSLVQTQNYQRKLDNVTYSNKVLQQNKIQEETIMRKSKVFYEQKIKEFQSRLRQYQEKFRQQSQEQMSLSNLNGNLKSALEHSERQRQNFRRNRTFDQLFQEIQSLCSNVREKESQIGELKNEISSLNSSSKHTSNEIFYLRQMLTKMIHLIQIFEQNRKQDQKSQIEEMKRLLGGQNILFQDLKQSTDNIVVSFNRQRAIIQSSQATIVHIKDSQIGSLRERLLNLQSQAYDQTNKELIISKIIMVAKENSELKGAIANRQSQKQYQKSLNSNFKSQIFKNNSQFQLNIQQKQQLIKKLQAQLDEANHFLFQQRQNQIKIQSSHLQIQSFKKYSQHELAARDELIKQLKNSLKLKNEQKSKASSVMEEQIHRNSKLNEEIDELKKIFNSQIFKKIQELQVSSRECESLRRQIKQLKTTIFSLQQQKIKILVINMQKLKEEAEILSRQNNELKSKPKHTNHSLICNECQRHIAYINELQILNKKIKAELESIRSQNITFKREHERNQTFLGGYNEKISILNNQFHRLQMIIEDLKKKNSQLMIAKHECQIQIQKQEIHKRRMIVLNEQITRLQTQNINLTEEVNVCRLQVYQNSSQEREIQCNHSLFVLVFVQIESLRERLAEKQKQIKQLRKNSLKI